MTKILWIGKSSGARASGNEIYDSELVAALRRGGDEIVTVAPVAASRLMEICKLLIGYPIYRSRYAGSANLASLSAAFAESDFDFAVCSWEHLDWLAYHLPGKVVPILHNVSSLALASLYPGAFFADLARLRVLNWEKRAYGSGRFPAIAVLSQGDADFVKSIAPNAEVVLAPPGMPAGAPLEPDARFAAEIILSGTYDWRPKRRDAEAFAREYAISGLRYPVFADNWPTSLQSTLAVAPLKEAPTHAIRIGLIPDRFQAGHKLKTTYYIANNAIIFTYADVSRDFAGIEDHSFFIRTIAHVSDIPEHVEEFAKMPADELVRRFQRFKAACERRFSWDRSARDLVRGAEAALLEKRVDAAQPVLVPSPAILRGTRETAVAFDPAQASRFREIWKLPSGHRSLYAGCADIASLSAFAAKPDVDDFAVRSRERLEWLAGHLPGKFMPALASVYPGQFVGDWQRLRALWEKRANSGRPPAIALLSHSANANFVDSVPADAATGFALPRMPKCAPLDLGRRLAAEIILLDGRDPPPKIMPSGMPNIAPLEFDGRRAARIILPDGYEWRPKRRDIAAYAREYAASGLRLLITANAPIARKPVPAAPSMEANIATEANGSEIIRNAFRTACKLNKQFHSGKGAISGGCADAPVPLGSDLAEDSSASAEKRSNLLVRFPAYLNAARERLLPMLRSSQKLLLRTKTQFARPRAYSNNKAASVYSSRSTMERPLSIYEIFRIIYDRKLIVILTMALAVVTSIVIFTKVPPVYEVSSLLIAGKGSAADLAEPTHDAAQDIRSLARVAGTDAVLGAAIKKVGLEKVSELAKPHSAPDAGLTEPLWAARTIETARGLGATILANFFPAPATFADDPEAKQRHVITWLRRKLTITADAKTSLLQLSLQGKDPVLGSKIVNAVADSLIERQFMLLRRPESLRFMEQEKKQLEKEAEAASLALSKFVSSVSIYSFNQQRDMLLQRSSDLAANLTETHGAIAKFGGQKQALSDHLRKLRAVANSSIVSGMVDSLSPASSASGETQNRLRDRVTDPPLLMVKVYQDGMFELLRTNSQLTGLTKLEDRQNLELSSLTKQLDALYARQAQYSQLQRAVEVTSAGVENYSKRMMEELAAADLEKGRLSQLQIVEAASIPDEVAFPKLGVFFLIAGFLGFFIGSAVAVASEMKMIAKSEAHRARRAEVDRGGAVTEPAE